jgi:hypothetical protein
MTNPSRGATAMNVRPTLAALAAAATLVTGLAAASPASAESVSVDDGADTPTSTTDILQVRAAHAKKRVKVHATFPDLQETGDAGAIIYFDTRRGQKGPEYGVGLPLYSGGGYTLMEMEQWQPTGAPVDCRYQLTLDWEQDRLAFWAARGCFDGPRTVRVGMRMRDIVPEEPVTDWLIGRRKWTERLSRAGS